ncbi:hypothetical protein GY14_30190 [Delftia tsuruhatensis]|nr:hypothetical protein GY14_30190 [Delftia tsuruhatensis]
MASNNTPRTRRAPAARETDQAGSLAPAAEGMRQVLQVVAKRDGFRRAGREWHGTTVVPLDQLTQEQFDQIQSEPMLVSMLMEVPEESVGDLVSRQETDSEAGQD